jgi:hypothetical protein
MRCHKRFVWLVFGALLLFTPQSGFAKCANMKAFYCAPAVF